MAADDTLTVARRCRSVLDLDADPEFEEYGYENLPLCVIDAVFSINARYSSVENLIQRYRERCGVSKAPVGAAWPPPPEQQQTVSEFLRRVEPLTPEVLAESIFGNRQRTSPRGGILKAEAVLRYCRALQSHGVETLQDMLRAAGNADLRRTIAMIPGHSSGISWNYLLMLCGDVNRIKPDRMVVRFVADALHREVTHPDAERLVCAAAACLRAEHPSLTPRRLDSLIWQYQARGVQIAGGGRRPE